MNAGLKIFFYSLLITFMITGCGSSSTDVNSRKKSNDLGYYDSTAIFYNKPIEGSWLLRGVNTSEKLLLFKNLDELNITDSYYNEFYTNRSYGVDANGYNLYTYEFYKRKNSETNETIYDYNRSIVYRYEFLKINDDDCFDVKRYKNSDFAGYFQLCPESSFKSYTFGGIDLVGTWTQYEYDENGTSKRGNELGIEFLYRFSSFHKIYMNITLVNQWIPLGEYSVNDDENVITYSEGSRLKEYEYIQDNAPMKIDYLDENNETNYYELPCIKVAKYGYDENNETKTLESFYEWCKKD